MSHRLRLLPSVFLLVSSLLALNPARAQEQEQPRVVEAVDNARRVTLPGNVHPLAREEFDRGAAADALPMTRMLLLLKRSEEQEAALQGYLEKQQDKSSANYHQWVTPQEFGVQYGPADADIQAVTDWLGQQGFQVNRVYSGKTVIEFSGTAAQVRATFGTEIHNYQVGEKLYSANANDPQIPAALAPVVAGIVSLNSFPRQSHARVVGIARKIAGKPGLEPLFTFPSPFGSGTFYGLAPGDFATIYNSTPLLNASPKNDGTGQTIAIVGETNINLADVQAFRQMFGLPANFTAANIILNGEDPGITSLDEEGEADLDVEWSGAVAPGATVDFVVSASTPASAGIDLSALYIIEHNLAGVMSESYGACEAGLGSAGNAFYNSLWEQAAAQGITAMVSAGDNGSAGCDDFNTATTASNGLAVSGLASTPYNVAVGGTDFDEVNHWTTYWSATNTTAGTDVIGTSALSYIPEIPWNENCAQIGLTRCGASAPNGLLNIVAGSGGPSSTYSKPKWQLGVAGMPNDNHRDLPDVSLFASPGFDGTGYVYCQSDSTITLSQTCDINNTDTGYYQFGVVGGTSASSPAFAGVMALVNQYQAGHSGTNRQGNANYVLYQLAKKNGASCTSSASEAAGCVFNDVTKGNSYIATEYGSSVGTNSVPCTGGSPNCSVLTGSNNGVLVEPTSSTTEAWTVTAGYDLVTGLGSVNVNNLATGWGSVSTVKTTTSLTLSPTTGITHGTNEKVTVNVSVTPTSATGNVSLIANLPGGVTQGLDNFTLGANGSVSGTTKNLPGGTNYTVAAHYAGDGTNAPSDSTGVAVTVAPETSQTFLVIPSFDSNGNQTNGNATSVPYGSNYFIRMYATDKNAVANATGPPSPACYQENALTCPTGTVTLTDNGTLVGTGGGGAGIYNLNSAGYTRNLTPNLLGGTHTLVASYSGDGSYQKSASAATLLTVTPVATQITAPGWWYGPQLAGSPVTLTTAITPYITNGVVPTGTVAFYDGGTTIPGTVSLSGSPVGLTLNASQTATFSTSGNHTITASYSGNASYEGVTSQAATLDIVYPTTTSFSASSTSIDYGQSINITATVTSSSKNPPLTGQVQLGGMYEKYTNVVTTPGTDTNGNQMLTVTATTTPQSPDWIGATFTGDTNYATSNNTNATYIAVNMPSFNLSAPASGLTLTAGQPGTLQLSVAPLTNLTSVVALTCNGDLPFGYTCSLQPANINLANGVTGTTVLTLSPSAAPALATAVRTKRRGFLLYPARWNPFWPLSALSGMTAFLLLLVRGRTCRRLSAGFGLVCVLSVLLGCGGSGGSGGGGGGGGGGTGPFATATTVQTSASKVTANGLVTLTATVTGKGNPTGTVIFFVNGAQIGQSNLSAGIATFQTTPPGFVFPGVYSITAQYSGDTSNLKSTSSPISEAVTGMTVMGVNAQTSTLWQSINVTVTVQ